MPFRLRKPNDWYCTYAVRNTIRRSLDHRLHQCLRRPFFRRGAAAGPASCTDGNDFGARNRLHQKAPHKGAPIPVVVWMKPRRRRWIDLITARTFAITHRLSYPFRYSLPHSQAVQESTRTPCHSNQPRSPTCGRKAGGPARSGRPT